MSGVLQMFRFRRATTALHTLDPRAKLTILIALSIASLALYDALSLLLLLALEVGLLAASKSLRMWARSLRGLTTLLALIFALNYLTLPSHKLFTSTAMTLRFLCLTTAFSIFFLTTMVDEIALTMESSGVPREYSMMLTMSLRFVPSLARDLQTVVDALRSKGLELEKGSLRTRVRNYSYALISLIVLELRRSLMIAEALEARAFGAVRRVEPYVELRLSSRDRVTISLSLLAVAAIAWLLTSGLYSNFAELIKTAFPEA